MIKIGGSLEASGLSVPAEIRELIDGGSAVAVVHGGGAQADRLAHELGRPPRYLTSTAGRRSRHTDAVALDALMLAMLGRVKPALITGLLAAGVRAVGLSGIDGGLITATRTPPARVLVDGVARVVRDDLSGRIATVDPRLVRTLTDAGYVPVVSPPALDPSAGPLNVDADRFAAALAVALGADWLIILSDVPGLLRDPADPLSLIAEVSAAQLPAYVRDAGGRMKVKLQSAADALWGGVRNVVLADGRRPCPVRDARAGAGTRIMV
ncbi:MAG: [LysW]-aminoadipate kinase [Solirubrobacteraceae bacterium]